MVEGRTTLIREDFDVGHLSYTVAMGTHRELHCTALGKLALAFSNPEVRKHCLSLLRLEAATDTTIMSRLDLETTLEDIHLRGVATALDERIRGASGIAAPILAPDGRLITGIVVIGPPARIGRSIEECTATVIDEARTLTQLIATAPGGFTRQR